MPTIPTLIRFIWFLNLVTTAFVIWRLFSLQLYKRYRFFFASMVLSAARTAALFSFGPSDKNYYFVWVWTQPLLWISYIFVVAELYFLVFGRYRGIYSLGRWFFFGAVFLAVILSALTVLPGVDSDPVALGRPLLLHYYAFMERGVVTSLAIFLILLLGFVSWFSVPLSANLLRHCVIYSAFFFAGNVVMLYWHAGAGKTGNVASLAKMSVGLACLLCWVFFLSRRGEDRIASLHLGRNAIVERKLLTQLENFNATLLRSARK